jgi:hypothetical protein
MVKVSDNLGIGISNDIAKKKYQADPDNIKAELYGDLSKIAGENPRGWRAGVAGFFKGAANASKLQASERFTRNMDYLEEINNSSMERKIGLEKQAVKMESMKPYAIGGLEVSYSGMPYEQGNERMRNLVEQAKINNPDIKGDYVGYIPNSPLVNMRDDKGNIGVLNLSSIAGEDSVKRIQGNYIDLQKEKTSRQNANTYSQMSQNKSPQDSQENKYGSIPLSSLKKGSTALINKATSQMGLAEEAPEIFHELNDARKIIAQNPEIGKGWSNFVGKSSITRGLLGKEDRAAYEKLDKIANRAAEAYIRAKGSSITEGERDIIKAGIFDVTQGSESKEYNIESIERELKKAYLRGKFVGDELSKGYLTTPQGFENYIRENPQLMNEVDQQYNLQKYNKSSNSDWGARYGARKIG